MPKEIRTLEANHYHPATENRQLHEPDQRALSAAVKIAEKLGISTNLEVVSSKQNNWTYADKAAPGLHSTFALQLESSDDLDALMERTSRTVEVARELREAGAPLQHYKTQPLELNGFVATLSEYIPYDRLDFADQDAAFRSLGTALAKLHTVSAAHPELVDKAPDFDPLAPTRDTYKYLAELFEHDPDNTTFKELLSEDFLEHFHTYLEIGDEDVEQMRNIIDKHFIQQSVVQQDVTPTNVRYDPDGKAYLIDLEYLAQGPREYDLGRPIGQWAQHFKRPDAWIVAFLGGYASESQTPINRELLQLSLSVSKIRYSSSLLTSAVNAAKRGEAPGQWQLEEGMRRFIHIGDPQLLWKSQDDYLSGM